MCDILILIIIIIDNDNYYHYKNIFKYIHSRGFDGILGMEHGNSTKGKKGELAVIKAYQESDQW